MQRTTRIQIVLALITVYTAVSAGQTSGSWAELMASMEKMHAGDDVHKGVRQQRPRLCSTDASSP